MRVPGWLLLASLALAPRAAGEDWLVAGPFDRGSRLPLHADPALEMFAGVADPPAPRAGEALGKAKWAAVALAASGRYEADALQGGVAYSAFDSDREQVLVACVNGATSLWVNGEPFVGDVYGYGFVQVPVALRKGRNHLLLRVQRGWFSFRWEEPPAPVFLLTADATLPDRVAGTNAGGWGAVPVVNATTETVRDAVLSAADVLTPLPPLAPLSVTKVPFPVGSAGAVTVRVSHGGRASGATFTLQQKQAHHAHARTFRSAIDGSTQFFGARAPRELKRGKRVALVLSLHGAGVGADGQAAAYEPLDWAAVAAPTNRRPYGFDWEEWGRLDALEVLAEARRVFPVDPSRIYLTGHSMGGHGTWQLGTLFPDLWAAVAPSAGWPSFFTYPPGATPVPDGFPLFRRTLNPSDTLARTRNLRSLPVFVIHGTADDNVPKQQADLVLADLRRFHRDLHTHFEAGAGHWWNGPAPGADCLTLPALLDFFQHRRRPDVLESWTFRTPSPAVSSRYREVEILGQPEPLGESRVSLRHEWTGSEQDTNRVEQTVVRTTNVDHIRVRSRGRLVLDGQTPESDGEFHRPPGGGWLPGPPAGPRKSPALSGPFPQAFHRPFLLVVPAGSDPDAARALLAKARYDAQVWWYRGNGLTRVVADSDVAPRDWQDCNLVLYGDAATNVCWKRVADRLPVRADPGKLTVGGRSWEGEHALLAVYPNPEAEGRLLALVGATGPRARRALLGVSWFHSGCTIPDVMAWGADSFTQGMGALRVAGWFGADWQPHPALWQQNDNK